MDIENDKTHYKAGLKIGALASTDVLDIVHGSVTFDFTAGIALGAIASASAALAGVTATHNVILQRGTSDAGVNFPFQNAAATAGVITVTAMNASAANKSAGGTYTCYAFCLK